MSFVTSFFIKPYKAAPTPPCNGSFVINQHGTITGSTIPSALRTLNLRRVGQTVHSIFRAADRAGIGLEEIVVDYDQLEVRARHFRVMTNVSLRAKSQELPPEAEDAPTDANPSAGAAGTGTVPGPAEDPPAREPAP